MTLYIVCPGCCQVCGRARRSAPNKYGLYSRKFIIADQRNNTGVTYRLPLYYGADEGT